MPALSVSKYAEVFAVLVLRRHSLGRPLVNPGYDSCAEDSTNSVKKITTLCSHYNMSSNTLVMLGELGTLLSS